MEAILPFLYFFDPERRRHREPLSARGTEARSKPDRRLYCAHCRHPITHQDERISVHGGAEHTFTNPHGITFHIGCFRAAAGCSAVGTPTTEYTWFPGYAWRVGLCARCETHLGWVFTTAGTGFHGLIVGRLTSTGPAQG